MTTALRRPANQRNRGESPTYLLNLRLIKHPQLFKPILLPLRHQAQSIRVPFTVLDPLVRPRRILHPTAIRHLLLLLTQHRVQLHIAQKRRQTRPARHLQPTPIIPPDPHIRAPRQPHRPQRRKPGRVPLVQRGIQMPPLEPRAPILELGVRKLQGVEVVGEGFEGEVLEAVVVGALVALSDEAHVLGAGDADDGAVFGEHAAFGLEGRGGAVGVEGWGGGVEARDEGPVVGRGEGVLVLDDDELVGPDGGLEGGDVVVC